MNSNIKMWLGLLLIVLAILKLTLVDINNDFLDFGSGLAFGAGLVWFFGSIFKKNKI